MSESDEQHAVCEYLEWRHVPYFAIPNGEKRGPKAQQLFKKLGGKPGVPDLCIPVAKGGYFGLYIEMKFGRNKPTDSQWLWLTTLAQQGYKTLVCWSANDAIAVIKQYMLRPETKREF